MEAYQRFVAKATLNQIKEKLRKLNLSTAGEKSACKVRLEKMIKQMNVDEVEKFFSEGENGEHGDGNEACGGEDNGTSQLNNTIAGSSPTVEDLNAELENLRTILNKKQEIANLKRQLASLCDEEGRPGPSYSFRDLEVSMQFFSGDDNLSIHRWVEIFEESMSLFKWDQQTALIYAKRLMTGTAKLFLRTVFCKSWIDLKQALLNEFDRRITSSAVHNELRYRKKKREETLQQYVLAMQEIAAWSDIEEEDIIHYIIKGIPDSDVKKSVLYTADTIDGLKDALRKYERMNSNTSSQESYRSSRYQFGYPKVQRGQRSSIKCYNCTEEGHISSKCPKPRRQHGPCFKCGKHGHLSKNCSQQTAAVLVIQKDEACDDSTSGINKYEFKNYTNEFENILRFQFGSEEKTQTELLSILDSGSPISFIQRRFIPPALLLPLGPNLAKYNFYGINNSQLQIVGRVVSRVEYGGGVVELDLVVVKDYSMTYPVALGRDFLRLNHLKFVTKSEKLTHIEEFPRDILNIDVFDSSDDLIINENLPFKSKQIIKNLVEETRNWHDISPTLPKNRLPYSHKIKLKEMLDDLLSQNIIRESDSPYASPIVLVKKKTGELRLCVDFRELNRITWKDNYPIPLIEDHLDRLRGKRYFTVLDLRSGFHHVKIADDSVKYTSFVTPFGQFEYRRMPFGLKNAPAVFQRYINALIKRLIDGGQIACIY